MESRDKQMLLVLREAISQLKQGQKVSVDLNSLESADNLELEGLKNDFIELSEQYNENYNFILDIAKGKLDTNPPFKNSFANPYKQLHSDLLHLTWQIQQISEGDYDQKVSFYGDFSQAINKMIESLKEKQRIDELNVRYLDELKELNAMKDKFFSVIAHDLKNPFTGLMGFSDILLADIQSKSYGSIEEYANIIKGLSEQGYKLLVNLLEWSRSQINSIKISIEPVSVKRCIEDSKAIAKVKAQQKNIEIIVSNDIDFEVMADVNMLNTILRNLLSNAVKYTNSEGRVIISAQIMEPYVKIVVSDNGVGIKPENLPKLFRLDYNTSTKGTNSEEGTGLGLILCKDFITKMRGDITVDSVYGCGTKFTISLPMVGKK